MCLIRARACGTCKFELCVAFIDTRASSAYALSPLCRSALYASAPSILLLITINLNAPYEQGSTLTERLSVALSLGIYLRTLARPRWNNSRNQPRSPITGRDSSIALAYIRRTLASINARETTARATILYALLRASASIFAEARKLSARYSFCFPFFFFI